MNVLPLGRLDDMSIGPIDRPSDTSWEIDWHGQRGILHVPRPLDALHLRVFVNGGEVARLAIPRGPRAHCEYVLAGSAPRVVIGLGALTETSTAIGVFVDGIEVNTQLTLEQWVGPFKETPDRFYEIWRPIVAQGWRYPLVFAVVGASPLFAVALVHQSVQVLSWGLGAFVVALLYAVAVVGLLRLLSLRRDWPVRLRLGIVVMLALAVPMALMTILAGSH